MAWVAVDKDGTEFVYPNKPYKDEFGEVWWDGSDFGGVELPPGTLRRLGILLNWEGEPVELK